MRFKYYNNSIWFSHWNFLFTETRFILFKVFISASNALLAVFLRPRLREFLLQVSSPSRAFSARRRRIQYWFVARWTELHCDISELKKKEIIAINTSWLCTKLTCPVKTTFGRWRSRKKLQAKKEIKEWTGKRLLRSEEREKVLIREMKMKKIENREKTPIYKKVDAAINIRNNYESYGGRKKKIDKSRKRTGQELGRTSWKANEGGEIFKGWPEFEKKQAWTIVSRAFLIYIIIKIYAKGNHQKNYKIKEKKMVKEVCQ